MTKTRKTPLPDRWDFDKWRNGSPLNPPKGPKVGIHWGDLLTLEYMLRDAEKNIGHAEREFAERTPSFNPVGADLTCPCCGGAGTTSRPIWDETLEAFEHLTAEPIGEEKSICPACDGTLKISIETAKQLHDEQYQDECFGMRSAKETVLELQEILGRLRRGESIPQD